MIRQTFAIAVVFALCGCEADPYADQARRVLGDVELELSAAGVSTLVVEQGEGTLTVAGGADASEIRASVSLASAWEDESGDEDAMAAARVSLEDEGDGVARLVARFSREQYGYGLPTVVEVPRELLVDATDGSGELIIDTVTAVALRDGSGDASITNIATDVTVEDGSGDLTVDNVGGSVTVFDGSGDLVLRDVDGHATITDGSGDIVLEDVQSWEVVEDGSGDVVED